MILLLNIVFGLLSYLLADYILAKAEVGQPARVIVAVIIGVVIFLANLASQVIH